MSRPRADEADLGVLVAEHLAWLRAAGYAATTVRHRRRALAAFAHWATAYGIRAPGQVTLRVLERYQVVLAGAPGDAAPSWAGQVHALGALRGFGAWLVRTRRRRWNPAAELVLPRRPRRLPRAVLSAGEVERILGRLDTSSALGLRDRAILETFYSTGLRRRELLSLRVDDVDIAEGEVRVHRGKGGRDRVVPIGRRALAWIQRYLQEVRPQHAARTGARELFLTKRGRRFRENRLSELVRRHLLAAQLGKSGSCHVFRHTMATLLLEGGRISEWCRRFWAMRISPRRHCTRTWPSVA